MTHTFWLAVSTGTAFGVGLVLIWQVLSGIAAPRLADRIRPHVSPYVAESTQTTTAVIGTLHGEADAAGRPSAWGTLARILRPVLTRGVALFSTASLGNTQLQARLAQAGLRITIAEYRAQQLLYALAGAALGLVISIGLALNYSLTPLLGVILVIGLAVLGFFWRDNVLSSTIAARKRLILSEFPTISELFAMSVSAGDTVQGSISRIAHTASGELADEFRRVLQDIHAGATLRTALQDLSDRLDIAPVERFISGLLVAVQRGTPLSAVLRAQAQDIRELSKRELMELAGKKEVGMMAPLVFGILPLTVIFAVYPGIALMNIGI